MKIYQQINKLVAYATKYLGLLPNDVSYATNAILDILSLPTFEQSTVQNVTNDVDSLLKEFCDVAVAEKVFEQGDCAYYCDKIMGALSLLPSTVDQIFQQICVENGSKNATDWLYAYGIANNYVKKAQLDKNPRFNVDDLVITINLAKPEFRDPKKAVAGNSVQGGYPKCVICRENQGLASRNKCTLRTVSLTLGGKPWFWQFSPFGYFYQHGIAVNEQHTPMKVNKQTYQNLLEFVDLFPHYFIGCNAALERIGGSVLAHDHYQGGGEILPMHNAKDKLTFSLVGYPDVKITLLDWYNTCFKVSGKNKQTIVEVCNVINNGWNNYTNQSLGIVARTNVQHNCASPTVVKVGDTYHVSIILRSNVTSETYPDGVFHAHPEFHVIKKESIGLIEAQGLFILPGRLQSQLAQVERCLAVGKLDEELQDFQMVFEETQRIIAKGVSNVHKAMEMEIGSICKRILQNTAVFKHTKHSVEFMQDLGFTLV